LPQSEFYREPQHSLSPTPRAHNRFDVVRAGDKAAQPRVMSTHQRCSTMRAYAWRAANQLCEC